MSHETTGKNEMPAFVTRDSSKPEFWSDRIASGVMPWDRAGVPQALQDYVHRLPTPRKVLIPGCGSAYEAGWLLDNGWQVSAIDFSAEAVSIAREVLGLHAEHVHEADFFRYAPPFAIDAIYERAFFCALPPRMRQDVVNRWAGLLPSGGQLFGFFYLGELLKGPPFSIREEELAELMQPYFRLLETATVADSLDVFKGMERWMVWQRL